MFYNHCNCEGNVTIIPSSMGIRQGDHLGGALFALTHFRAFHFITNHFPFYLFSSITNDIHIKVFFQLYHLHMNIFRLNLMQ
jgi:hypothetical protein